MKKRLVAFLLVLIMVLGMLPVSAFAADDGVSPQALESNETQTIKYQILYVGDEFNIGYNYGASVNKTYTCQYSTGHSGFNHSILISEFRNVGVPALKGQLDSGYEFVGWAKEAKKNPTIFDFNTAGTTATQTTYTIYLVAKKTNPTPTYMYYLYYKYNDGTNSTWLTEQSGEHGTAATTFTFYVNTAKLKDRRGYEHIGWADKANAAAAKYTGGEVVTLTKDDPTKTIYAVWMPFFELKYDANGGTGAPASQTRTASAPTVNRVTFTVPGTIPTKDGCTFKGWADSAAATTAQYQPGGTVDVKHENSPKTVYAVWEGSDPIPVPSYDDLKSAIGQIQVKDVSTPSCGTENYDLIDNTQSEPFNWTKTARLDQPGKYDVTIKTAPYVAKYNSEKSKTHELNNANQTTLKLVISYENNTWKLDDGLRVIEVKHSEQTPPTDKPDKPTKNDVTGVVVDIVCVTTTGTHDTVQYPLGHPTDAQHTIGEVVSDGAGGYICPVTVRTAWFVQQASNLVWKVQHTPTAQTITFNLTYDKNSKTWVKPAANPRIEATHEVTPPTKPTALDGSFAIVCKNNKATHPYKADYIATPSQYTISDVQKDEQGYYVTATVTVAPNLVAYNTATRVEHRLVDEQDATLTITFRYDTEVTGDENRKWTQQGELPVVEVICKPKAPTADDLKKLEMAVQVKCVVDASQQHTEAYSLLGEYDEDYFVGEPRKDGDDWLCDISYVPDLYVAEFNTTFQNLKHVQNDEQIVPVTLIWAGDSWQLKTQGRVHVTEVYTVTFDSYGGTPVPPAQEVEYGLTATKPADPTLKGYTFAFWYLGEDEQNATAYDFNTPVTENITLTAKWNINKYTVTFNSYGGTPVPPVQEVEYGLTATKPADPTLKGYTFAFWYLGEDEQNATAYDFDTPVTENITLTAKWHVTPHNIYAFARLNSAFAPLTSVEFGEFVKLNDATLTRLGLGSYNANNYISIGTFSFNKLPLMGDDFMSYYGDEEFDAVVAELADNIVLETGVSKKVAEKIAWTYLFKADNSDYMTEAGYPTDDENGYQLSGNLNLATVMFKANGENVTGMPTVNYTYDDIFEIHDFYFAGDTFTLPADPTREGYSFEGWSVKVIPDENDADHLDADGADDAADETLLKAGDTYTITAGGVIFTAQWKLNTYIIASDLRINGDTANLADGKTYAWTHRYGGNYGETIDYQPMFDALKARALAVDAANEPYDAEIKLCFPGNKNKLFNETILTYGQEGGGWNPGVKNTAYIWGYATTSYEVIFNSDGGSAVDTQIVKYGEKAVKPEDPTMKGYNFLGWFDKDGNPFDFDTEITHKTELKAQWEKKDYIIASDLRVNGGEAVKDEGKTYAWTHRYGGKYEETIDYQPMFDALKARALEADKDNEPNPTKVDVELRFPGSSNLFNETILTYGQDGANWQAANNTAYIWGYAWTYYDVTFVTPEGATTVDAQLIKNGDCAAKPADPTKEGWKFLGWYADAAFKTEFNFDAPITKKTSVYAKFELTSTPIGDIYVRYDVLHIKQLPDGTYDLANAEVEHLRALKDTTVTAVIKDYRATHHVNVNRTLSKLTGTAIQPYMGVDGKPVYTILSVYYDLDFHTLTFDTMGGSKIAPETVRHGLTVAKPKDPVNGGYIFDGWYTDKTFRHRYDFSTPLTEDITIYAKWFLIVLPGVTVKKNTPKLNTADHFAYVQGYPDGTVKPAGNITRAETAAILFRLMDDASRKTYYSTKSGFRDVASGSWYNTYVATLNNAGVITDSSNGYFRPNEAITRAELAAMLAKFSETTGAANYFNDVSAKYWAANAIAICAKLGWITGYPDGTFRPDKNVTRAELMAMINRATGRAPKSADAFLPGMKTWIDNTSDKWYYLDVQEATNSHSYTVKGSETWTALTSDPNWSLYE